MNAQDQNKTSINKLVNNLVANKTIPSQNMTNIEINATPAKQHQNAKKE